MNSKYILSPTGRKTKLRVEANIKIIIVISNAKKIYNLKVIEFILQSIYNKPFFFNPTEDNVYQQVNFITLSRNSTGICRFNDASDLPSGQLIKFEDLVESIPMEIPSEFNYERFNKNLV